MADANCGTLQIEEVFALGDVTIAGCDLRFGTSPRENEAWTGGVIVANDGPDDATVSVGTYAAGSLLGTTETTVAAGSSDTVSVPTFDTAGQLADLAGVEIGESFDFGYAIEAVNGQSVDRTPSNCGSVVVRPSAIPEDDLDVSGCSITRERVQPGQTTEAAATITNNSDIEGPVILELLVDGEVVADREIALRPGDSARIGFEIPLSAISPDGSDVAYNAIPTV